VGRRDERAMRGKGVCYDVGRVMLGQNWRPNFDEKTIRRELEIIRNDLHCNAVRLQGLDLDRLRVAADHALRLGLETWISPEMWDREQAETLAHVEKGARMAEELRQRWPDRVVYSVGSEVTLFTQGFLPGSNILERLHHPSFLETVRAGKQNGPLNSFLTKANASVRQVFHGPVTYASVGMETVDWTPFDFVGVDMYREKRFREVYPAILKRFMSFGKPVANMEFGCCTFRGADDMGGQGWTIVDWGTTPPRLNATYVYDQATQAREDGELLWINDAAGVDTAFVFTFVEPAPGQQTGAKAQMVRSLDFDPDIVGYSLVKTLLNGQPGSTYPDMPWEPKESFRVVADYYGSH
jgi:hypothetical protein